MRSVSIRARLTATIVVLTGALAALGVWGGTAVLRSGVVDSAADVQLAGLKEFDAEDTLEGLEPLIVDDLIEASLLGENEFGEDELEAKLDAIYGAAELEDAVFAREIIGRLELFDELSNNFGARDGRVPVQLATGRVILVDRSGALDFDVEFEPAQPVVSVLTLFDLEGVVFERLEKGERSIDYEFTTADIDGTTFGLVLDVSDELRALDEVTSVLWLAAVLLTALAAISTWLIVGRALRPVRAITGRVQEISASDLAERVPEPSRRDEIGVLAVTMNDMLGRLERSDLRRRQFVSDASHELRTPVAVLQSEAEVARRAPDSTTVPELAEVVHVESRRLASLVEDLLAIARHDESSLGSTPGRRSAAGVVDVDDIALQESARERGVAVDRSRISGGRIRARPEDVRRVLAHLLDNAARHALSQVALAVRTIGDEVEVVIDDDGSGIPADDRDRVFRRFVRLDDARTRDEGGAGLGLAVARSLVEASGGTITAAASPLGGARLRILWPSAA